MAIIRYFNSKNSMSKGKYTLKRVLNYISNPEKTAGQTGGLYVNEKNALERMRAVKQYYGKEDGRIYIHFTISFKGKRDVQNLYEFAEEVSEQFSDFQVLFAIHNNTANHHIHFVINSVSISDGHKFSQSRDDMNKFKKFIAYLEQDHGLDNGFVDFYINDTIEDYYDDNGEDEHFECAPFEEYISKIPNFDELTELVSPIEFFDCGGKELTEPVIFYKR